MTSFGNWLYWPLVVIVFLFGVLLEVYLIAGFSAVDVGPDLSSLLITYVVPVIFLGLLGFSIYRKKSRFRYLVYALLSVTLIPLLFVLYGTLSVR